MFAKITFEQTSQLTLSTKTTIQFDKNLQFTVSPLIDSVGKNYFLIEDIKGDLEITWIKACNDRYGTKSGSKLPFDNTTKTFLYEGYYHDYLIFKFSIIAKIDVKTVAASIYQLQIPSARMNTLQLYECFQSKIVLPDYDDLPFSYFVKRCKDDVDDEEAFEIHIENPYNARINYQQGDFIFHQSLKDVNRCLSFVVANDSEDDESDKLSDGLLNGATKSRTRKHSQLEKDEQNGEPTHKKSKINSKWFEIMSNDKYSDVVFISSDNIEIKSYRCVLAKHSPIFAKIFDESIVLPVTINVEEFNGEIIQSALNFLCDKIDYGKEIDVFNFAARYGIQDIITACCSYFEESVNPKNVCELIQVAYSNNYEELKQKCLKILVKNKKDIDASKFADLPKNILIDFFNF